MTFVTFRKPGHSVTALSPRRLVTLRVEVKQIELSKWLLAFPGEIKEAAAVPSRKRIRKFRW